MIAVTGAAEVLGNLAAMVGRAALAGNAIEDELKNVMSEEARGMVAVETGETQESITITDDGVSVGGAAVYLEFGTYKMSAQPFFRPAMDIAAQHDVVPIAQTTLFGGM